MNVAIVIHYVHLVLHVVAPAIVARLAWRQRFRQAFVIMLLANLVDLDHLLARPLYDPHRCSLGFHPLHAWPAIAAYSLLLVPPRTRILAVGLLLHMSLDGLDCLAIASR